MLEEAALIHSRCDSAPMMQVNITQSASYLFASLRELWAVRRGWENLLQRASMFSPLNFSRIAEPGR
jgi:hypothetical protein